VVVGARARLLSATHLSSCLALSGPVHNWCLERCGLKVEVPVDAARRFDARISSWRACSRASATRASSSAPAQPDQAARPPSSSPDKPPGGPQAARPPIQIRSTPPVRDHPRALPQISAPRIKTPAWKAIFTALDGAGLPPRRCLAGFASSACSARDAIPLGTRGSRVEGLHTRGISLIVPREFQKQSFSNRL